MKCKHIKADGKGCNAHAMTDSEYCFRHNAKMKEIAVLASVNGGKGNKHISRALQPQIKLKKTKDVTRLLSRIINELYEGNVTPKVATSIGYLSSQFIKAMEISDLEKRIEILERKEKNLHAT